jgi:putative membrane protein
MHAFINYLKPWEFSPSVFASCALPAAVYTRGLMLARRAGETVGYGRPLAFFLGLGLIYAVLQTRVDYLSQHMFWIHRLQHLVLHHVGPVLIVLAAPLAVMERGLPQHLGAAVRTVWGHSLVRVIYRFVQNPVVAPLLFVGLIYFWLIPAIHFTAMLSADRYRLMNWSMAVDGIFFWWLMLAPREAQGQASVSYLVRILILWAVMILQIIIGSYISLHNSVLYDVYGLCGRAWAIDPLTDQEFGGLLTWIPPAMMSVTGILIVVRYILHQDQSPSSDQTALLARTSE